MKVIISSILCYLLCFTLKGQNTDSLLQTQDQTTNREKIEELHELVISLWLNYPDKAMKYGNEALGISQNLGDSMNISKSLRLIAGVYYYKSDFDVSLDYNLRALEIATFLKDSALINNGYNNIGLLYYNLGSYQTALEYLIRSKNIKDKIGETYGLPTTLNNIGLVFNRVGNYEEARSYFLEAYDAAIKEQDQSEVYALNNIGITYLKEEEPEIAMTYFRKALALAKSYKNINWGSVSLRGIGEVYVLQNQLDSARFYCLQSLTSSESIDDKKGIVEVYTVLTKLEIASGNLDQAKAYLEKSQNLAAQLKLRQDLQDNLKLFIQIFEKANDVDQLINYQNMYMNLRDSIIQDVISRNLGLVPIKLKEESDRITLTKQQIALRSKEFKNKLYTIILIILIPLAIILIILLRKNQLAHRELIAFNEELQRTQKLLITSEKMASLGVMATGIAHEINNPLNFIKNGVEALDKKISEIRIKDKTELISLFKIVNEGVTRASNIVKSLSHFSRKSPTMDEKCNVKEIIENCLLILHSKIKGRIRVKTSFVRGKKLVKGNEGRLHQAMMNIIANAEQAIKGQGTIEIRTAVVKNELEITIQDDGEGITEENLTKIGDPFFTTKPPGEGTGLGLFITFSIIEEHNGKIEVISSPDNGTRFIISLPLA